MGRICVVTMDHNTSTVGERVSFASSAGAFVGGMADGSVAECVRLSTCNRDEFYMVISDSGDEKSVVGGMLRPGARVLFDYEAVRHLLRVLLGLESMAVGESHIVSQVRSAYASAPRRGRILHRLFQRAMGMSSALRSRYHPGREPSMPFIMADHFAKNFRRGGRGRVMVAGLGAIGAETAHILLLMGFEVLISNRTPREPDGKIAAAAVVPWSDWKEEAGKCDAVFLCTSAGEPILSAPEQDSMPDVWVIDLGSPHQSEKRNSGARITLDDMNEIAASLASEYRHMLETLEDEADKASSALIAEISVLTDDTWKRLALARAHGIIADRVSGCAKKTGADERDLEAFANSVMKAFLHPLVMARTAHGSRAWRILSGESGEDE